MNTNIAENYAKTIVESVNEFTKESVIELLKQAYIAGSLEREEELQLIDIEDELQLDDIDDELQLEEFDNAIDGNVFLDKLS